MPLTPPSSSSTPSRLPRSVQRLDRLVGARINAWPAAPHVDTTLLRLSTAANNAVLWYSIAGVLALTGRRGRRGAVRGLMALGLSSAVTNLVAKPLVGGARPAAADVPVARHLATFPQSASFPSGHTASAVAFATGAALESPVGALVAVPFAAGVAYSRLHVGAHWLSDVVGGAVIGAGMGVASGAVLRLLDLARRR